MRNVDLFVVSFNGGVLDIFNVHFKEQQFELVI